MSFVSDFSVTGTAHIRKAAWPSPLLMNLVIGVLFKNPPLNLVGSPALLEASQRLIASSKVAKG